MESRTEKSHRLFEIAKTQQGYFTSADAKSQGYDYPLQFFHVKRGNWLRVDHGIYRLKKFPAARHEELMRWWLWSRKKAVLSHETAAALYDLGDLLPSKIHMTVTPDFRKKPTKSLVLHKAMLHESEIEKREGVPVTKPLRTILDLARAHLDEERLEAVARKAILKGVASGKELLGALATAGKGIDAATQATLRLAARVGAERPYAERSIADEVPQIREEAVGSPQPLKVHNVLGELKAGLRLVYGDRLRGIYLFGSYARGEADRESDLDILVVLDAFDRYAHEVNRTGALAADLSLKYGVTVSLVFLREREWLKGDTPFLSNVRDEAIPA
jgi:predicted nucleotidyltransferase